MDERQMVQKLKIQLAPRYREVLVHQNLANLTRFRSELEKRFGFLPVLNEIDMIVVGMQGHLSAIEVKCFNVTNGSFSRPFYDGIGQSLSLLRYGFDHVALWHLFPNEIEQKRLDRYGAGTWWFIRNQLKLPLDFTYFKVGDNLETPKFIVMQYQGPNESADLLPIDSSNFVVTWKHTNPFVETDEAQCLRAALIDALGICFC